MDAQPATNGDDLERDRRIAAQLKEFLNKKVNAMNAFDTPIVEGLSSAVKVETLQCVGALLDASAKCYALRVDNTFGACYKVLSTTEGENMPSRQIDEEEDQNDQDEAAGGGENSDESNVQAEDAGTSKDGEGNEGTKKKRKIKEARVELSSRSNELTKKIHKMAEQMAENFVKGENVQSDEELNRALNDFTTDIGQNLTNRRVGIPFLIDKPGALDRKDNQFSIEDAIYRKVSKDFEEGSARSFVSNEVLMNFWGNFMILHNHWPGKEPQRAFPSLSNHLMEPCTSSQNEVLVKMNSLIERAQCEQPAEYALLTKICADEPIQGDAEELPAIHFDTNGQNLGEQPMEMEEEQPGNEVVDDTLYPAGTGEMEDDIHDELSAMNGGIDGDHILLMDDQNGTTNGHMDATIIGAIEELDEVADIEALIPGGEQNGRIEILDGTNAEPGGLKGKAFGDAMAQKENTLAGGIVDNEQEEAVGLIDENLLPPTQDDDIEIVPLKNTQIEDNSHWKGRNKLPRGEKIAQTPKKARSRKNAMPGTSRTKRQPAAGAAGLNLHTFGDIAAVEEDLFWLSDRLVSDALGKAIGAQFPEAQTRKKLQFDVADQQRFTPRNLHFKQQEPLEYDPFDLIRARYFSNSAVGIWSYRQNPNNAGGVSKRLRFVRYTHPNQPIFGQTTDPKSDCAEFNRIYFELTSEEQRTGQEADGPMNDGGDPISDGDISDIPCSPGGHLLVDRQSPPSTAGKKRVNCRLSDDGEEWDTGFGFLNNFTLRDIVLICQNNFNVAKVKGAILKVLSTEEIPLDVVAGDEMEEDEADESEDENYANGIVEEEEDDEPDRPAIFTQTRDKISSRELFAKLPNFLSGATRKNLNVVNAFAVLLHICNDRQFTLTQPGSKNKGTPMDREQETEKFTQFVINLATVPERTTNARPRKRAH